jgi:hypothetical protein
MAFLYISEFSQMPFTDNAVGHSWAMTPPIVDQTRIAINGSISATSSNFNVNTRFVRLAVDSSTACNVVFGAAGTTTLTAGASNCYLPKSWVEYFGVQGDGMLAVVGNGT